MLQHALLEFPRMRNLRIIVADGPRASSAHLRHAELGIAARKKADTMSNTTLTLPVHRRLALNLAQRLERWALEAEAECESRLAREQEAYRRALAQRERHVLLSLRDQPLR